MQLISGSSAPLVLENGARYLMWNAPFYAVLGVLLCTRYALQSLGQKVLPLFSSVIELLGKVIFVLVFIPRYAYNAVIDVYKRQGPNHTLPTSGTARFSSPLGVDDFVKKSSFIYYTRDALEAVAPRA